ncbi:MAG: DUF5301 domain-containing protein [Bacillota bacterium]
MFKQPYRGMPITRGPRRGLVVPSVLLVLVCLAAGLTGCAASGGRDEAAEQALSADDIEGIQIRMLFRGKPVAMTVEIPSSNSQGRSELVDLLNAASPTGKTSANDLPPYDRLIEVTLRPVKTVYLYEKDRAYFAETPHGSIKKLTEEAYNLVREYFGPIRPFPEELAKTEFLAAIQDTVDRYRSGNPPENPMEHMFDAAPSGIALPEVDSADDFELTDGDGTECLYLAIARFGPADDYQMEMLLNKVSLPGENKSSWVVSGVHFQGLDNKAAYLFDLAIANRFDYVPRFEEGNAPAESPDYLYYAFILNVENWKAGDNFLTEQYVEEVITSHFEVGRVVHKASRDWNFDGKVYTIARPSSYAGEPIYGLKEYRTYTESGRTIYDVVLEGYGFDEFSHWSMYEYQLPGPGDSGSFSDSMQYVMNKKGDRIKSGELTVPAAIRQMIAEDDTKGFTAFTTEHFKFYFDADTGKVVFLEHTTQYR